MQLYLKYVSIGFVTFTMMACNPSHQVKLSPIEKLGKKIFFDENLSEPIGQSCATCHTATKGFADRENRAISEGAVIGLFSKRNAPTIAYSAFVPSRYYDKVDSTYVGGLFWDGRVNSLEVQARNPFVNLLEMGNLSDSMLVQKLKKADYYGDFVALFGKSTNVGKTFDQICDALAAYQRSAEINSFSSKYDAYLDGKVKLSKEEMEGLVLFSDAKRAKCAECHILEADPRAKKVLFTDHTYDNLGIPKNLENPFYQIPKVHNPQGQAFIDFGLGEIVKNENENGKFRVPTLRNIAQSAPYGHNGYFKTLEEIVHFYNVRDLPNQFPVAEYPNTVNTAELGDLKLSLQEEKAIVSFMKTLSDGYIVP
ncbi:MAG: cytochrome c peroxidase [Bacteroidales bacterium]